MSDLSEAPSSYSRILKIDASAEAIFEALTVDLEGWWGKMDKPVTTAGDVFKVVWRDPWYQFEVTTFAPPYQVNWRCIDANQIIHGLEDVQKEWVGTELQWRIEPEEKGSCMVLFRHQGLVPDFICYDFCSKAWDHFLGERLKAYLEE